VDEAHYKLLRLIESRPDATQRELAQALGVSLGKVNYCVNALIEKGLVKARNFRNNQNKLAYAYLLTPRGIEQKAAVTVQFLRRKVGEYEALQREIAELRREVERGGSATDPEKGGNPDEHEISSRDC
jgi:EPS-associated MarR family transcriptional regulator